MNWESESELYAKESEPYAKVDLYLINHMYLSIHNLATFSGRQHTTIAYINYCRATTYTYPEETRMTGEKQELTAECWFTVLTCEVVDLFACLANRT